MIQTIFIKIDNEKAIEAFKALALEVGLLANRKYEISKSKIKTTSKLPFRAPLHRLQVLLQN